MANALTLAGLIVAGQALDALTFVVATTRLGIAGEANPVGIALHAAIGLWGVVAVKVVAGTTVAAIITVGGPRLAMAPSLVGRTALFLTALGLLGASTNMAALL